MVAWKVAIAAPTLVVRGVDSDLLTEATAAEMALRGPRAERLDVPGAGHAPTLNGAAEIAAVRAFLDAGS